MELPKVELCPEDCLRLFPRAHPRKVSNLVAARLANRCAIALDLALNAGPREARGLHHIVDGLFPAPTLGVQSGVDDQTGGSEQEGLEVAALLDALVPANLVRKLLGIKKLSLRSIGMSFDSCARLICK